MLAQRHAYSGTDAVASAALFFGEDTTESLNPVDIFKNPINHATAASSVVVFSAAQAGFQPSEKSAESLPDALDDFVRKVSTFPGWFLSSNRQSSISLKNHTTVEEFEHVIRESIPTSHNGKIAFKFAELLPLDLDFEEEKHLKNWILSLVVIDKPEGGNSVSVLLAYVSLSIAFDKESKTCSGPAPTPKAYIPEQRVSINYSDFKINAGFLIANAQQLANKLPIVDVETTIALLTSPARNGPKAEDRLFEWGSQQKVFSF